MKIYHAHSANVVGAWHPLKTHLQAVANLAAGFATPNGPVSDTHIAGLVHDIGKYGDSFQSRLRGEAKGLDHWSQGALLAAQLGSIPAAFACQGHHIGLQSMNTLRSCNDLAQLAKNHPLQLTLSDADLNNLKTRFTTDGLTLPALPKSTVNLKLHPLAKMLDVRRVFSALVDADYLDTDAHFNGTAAGKQYRKAGVALQASTALDALNAHLTALNHSSQHLPPLIRNAREQVLANCRANAQGDKGLFTLTAPTGSGKTLAMLAFALEHAQKHDLRRIVMVVPYLTIIEQTVEIYRALFPKQFWQADYILEHHSLAKAQDDNHQTRLRHLAENWDAPIIVTTNVQLLESLFANRPAACRKLHRLANSVILLDEVQTLPQNLAVPTLAALSQLAHGWGSSVVMATATQPAFEHLHSAVNQLCPHGWQPCPIVESTQQLTDDLRRCTFVWPKADETLDWPSLATQLHNQTEPQSLTILNTKKHAQAVWEALNALAHDAQNSVYHLSTNLCPAHRSRILTTVKTRLLAKQPCHLVATQCVEAGVDVDFPIVWRALAPLDAIIQAAGRCNRNGRRATEQSIARVFRPAELRYPPGGYEQAAKITEKMLQECLLRGQTLDPLNADTVRSYYKQLYDTSNAAELSKAWKVAIDGWDFPAISGLYTLIDNNTINVIVPYSEEIALFNQLQKDADNHKALTAEWVRSARPITVSVFRPKADDGIWARLITIQHRGETSNEWYFYAVAENYHPQLGLMDAQNVWIS